MDQVFMAETLERWLAQAEVWIRTDVLTWATLVQLAAILVALGLARLIAPAMGRAIGRARGRLGRFGRMDAALAELEENILPITWLAIQWPLQVLAARTAYGGKLIEAAVSLLAAWIVIQFVATLIHNPGLRRTAAILAWSVAALNVFGWLGPVTAALDGAAVELGDFRLSVLVVIKGLALFALLLWAAFLASRTLERRLGASGTLSPSIKVLFGQFSKIVFVTLAVVVSLAAVGVDLTAFAVFTGALGVGLGLGLQKVVANLFSGILLLTDRSIKPGDVIAVEQTYGWVSFMGARYVSVITRDGTEHLIPNETLITTPVENWSYSNNLLRIKIPLGISYNSDPHKVIGLVVEAAGEVERVLADPKPICLLTGFGDSSVDLEVRVWINDPRNGIGNVKSAILLKVWDKFHANGIEIPFPQRDLHIRTIEATLPKA